MIGILPDIHGQQIGHELQGLTASPYVHAFVFLMFLDIITGYAKAIKTKQFDSKTGTLGLLRHTVVFITIIVVGAYSRALGVRPFGIAWCMFFVTNYAYSVLENWEVLRWGFPKWLKKYVNQVRKANDSKFAELVGVVVNEDDEEEKKENANDNSK